MTRPRRPEFMPVPARGGEPIPLPLLDPNDPSPPYQQIAQSLRNAILQDVWRPGDLLPSQPALAAHFGVSRETVKRALAENDDLVEARPGEGTYVRINRNDLVRVPRHILQYLVHHAFTHLWYLSQDPEAGNGCCQEHCGVCSALFDLHEDPNGDKLSEALRKYCKPGDGWWIDDHVDWDAMQAAWKRGKIMCCGNLTEE